MRRQTLEIAQRLECAHAQSAVADQCGRRIDAVRVGAEIACGEAHGGEACLPGCPKLRRKRSRKRCRTDAEAVERDGFVSHALLPSLQARRSGAFPSDASPRSIFAP